MLTENSKSKSHIALKLYQQFTHPLPDKIKLIQLGTHSIHIRNLRNQYEKSAKNVTSTRKNHQIQLQTSQQYLGFKRNEHKCNFHYAAMPMVMSQILNTKTQVSRHLENNTFFLQINEFTNYTSWATLWHKIDLQCR